MSGASPASDEDPAVAVYDGRVLIGLIFDRWTGCVATDADRGRSAASQPGRKLRTPTTRRPGFRRAASRPPEMTDATDTELAAPDSKHRDIIPELPVDAE